ncbi:T9SS type A sorting domain-containing protein [Crocinitomix catalasitica]|nr:T9SS type A sorting domain-containing protein [Crocinitomix catalasitica]
MKKCLVLCSWMTMLIANLTAQSVITSTANGDYHTASTWDCVCVPTNDDIIFVNHNVTYASSIYVETTGEFTINSIGTLTHIGNSNFYIRDNNSFSNNGTFSTDDFYVQSGSALNTGNFTTDDYYNNLGYSINYGTITTLTDLYTDSIEFRNYGEIYVNEDFYGRGYFLNAYGSFIEVGRDFYAQEAVEFTNNGFIHVSRNWYNQDTIGGTGIFCIDSTTYNQGHLLEPIDICDLSPTAGSAPYVDNNVLGSFDSGVLWCASSCNEVASIEHSIDHAGVNFSISPNPIRAFGILHFEKPPKDNYDMYIYNLRGEIVWKMKNISDQTVEIDLNWLEDGLYILQFSNANEIIGVDKIIKE